MPGEKTTTGGRRPQERECRGLTIDAAVGIVDYAHITPQEGKAIMGQSGTIRRDAYAYNSPALPVTAKVTWDNGKVADEKIVWDAVPAASYQKTGSFTA